MTIETMDLPLPGLRLIQPRVFREPRGHFVEIHHSPQWRSEGLPDAFVQDNLSFSRANVLRGLHFQWPQWQAKLITVVAGEIFDVAVDLRRNSPAFGRWHGVTLSAEEPRQLLVPEGFAHGFCVTGKDATVVYKCSSLYRPDQEYTLLWNDPEMGIDWPVKDPILSAKDAQGILLRDLPFPG